MACTAEAFAKGDEEWSRWPSRSWKIELTSSSEGEMAFNVDNKEEKRICCKMYYAWLLTGTWNFVEIN